MNEVFPPPLRLQTPSFQPPFGPIPHTNRLPPSIPLLPPSLPLYVSRSRRNRCLLPSKVPTNRPRTANGQAPRNNLLVLVSMLLSPRVRELYQDG
jgi:hypothetical protein